MNKKFFSAVLMGALLLGGTFVSCQDYDDDIENLQNQIDKLASASDLSAQVSSLQSQISAAQSAAEAKAAAAETVAKAAQAAADAKATPAEVAAAAQEAAKEAAASLEAAKTALDAKIEAAQKAADAANEALKNAATKEEVAAAKNAANEANTALEALKAEAGAKADAAQAAQDAADAAKAAADAGKKAADVAQAVEDAVKTQKAVDDAQNEKLEELAAALEAIQKKLNDPTAAQNLDELAAQVKELSETVNDHINNGDAVELVSVNAPAYKVDVERAWAVWAPKKIASTAENARRAILLEKFEDIDFDAKGDTLDQGGKLTVLVNPSTVNLTKGYKFSLEGADGKEAEAVVSTPVIGIAAGTAIDQSGVMFTRAADDCFWNLSVVPAKDKFRQYQKLDGQTLVIENEAGEIFKTPFAYYYTSKRAGDVKVSAAANAKAFYSEAINLFDKTQSPEGDEAAAVFTVVDAMTGHFVIKFMEPADVVKYGLDTEGSNLIIKKFPSDKDEITIRDVKVVALGLNGSTDEAMTDIKICKTVDVDNTLSEIDMNLDLAKANKVRWTVADEFKNMDAAQIESVINAIKAGNAEFKVFDAAAANNLKLDGKLVPYKANGQKATAATNYKDVKSFGFDFKFNDLPPYTYDVEVTISNLFKAVTTLTTHYPTDGLLKLRSELCDEDGVLQITGDADDAAAATGFITYDMELGFEINSKVTIKEVVDLEADSDDDWMASATGLKVNKNSDEYQKLYTPRNFKVVYTVDNNAAEEEMEFQAMVVSPVYFGEENGLDAKNAYKKTTDVEKLKNLAAVFGDKEQTLTVKDAIVKGIYAAGSKKGQTYDLWVSGGSAEVKKISNVEMIDYTKPDSLTNLVGGSTEVYIKNKSGKVYVETDQDYIIPFGWDKLPGFDAETQSIKLDKDMYKAGMATMKKYYFQNDTTGAMENIHVLVWKEKSGSTITYGKSGQNVYYQVISDTTHTEGTDIFGQSIVQNAAGDNLKVRFVDPSVTGKQHVIQLVGDKWYYSDNYGYDGWKLLENIYSDTKTSAWSVETKEDIALTYPDTANVKVDDTTRNDIVGDTDPTIAGNTIAGKKITDAQWRALEVLTIKYCKNLMKELGFSTKITHKVCKVAKAAVDKSLATPELVGEPTFELADEVFAGHFIKGFTASNGSFSVKAASDIDETVVPAGGVKIIVNMIVKDKWGMTMKAPIEVVLTTK